MFDITEKMDDSQKIIYQKYSNSYPFKIVEFINDLGVIVTAADMPSYISGAVRKEDNGYRIYFNDKNSSTRIRFTLAHELGHFFYDRDYLDSNEIIDPSKQSERNFLFRKEEFSNSPEMREMDTRANQFAASILMPENKFIEIWQSENSPLKVANFFKVSEAAVIIRASNLIGEIF
jgi:Zn-dependent peptidase ImmA (M78 family)